jgi:hypothetical protein
MTEQTFKPFSDRLSRDIRNQLSESFVTVLQEKSMDSARKIAKKYLTDNLSPCYSKYIKSRLERYNRCLAKIAQGNKDPLWQGLVLWDEHLFFEVHEILEHAWMHAEGDEKFFLQAMIRAAGVYIKIDAGYDEPASRIAAKALPVLKKNYQRLAQYTDPDRLTGALTFPISLPPQLLD